MGNTVCLDCQRGKFSFYTKAPKSDANNPTPEYLDTKLIGEMNAEFELDAADDWMETTELVAPSSGAAIGMRNDGYTELVELDDDSDVEEAGDDEEMEEGEVAEGEGKFRTSMQLHRHL